MSIVVVGVAEMQISGRPGSVLTTYALGSCIAVTAYDPHLRVGGMIHYMLPLSTASGPREMAKTFMFADTGIPALFHALYERGCLKERLIVCVAGGAQVKDDEGMFNIGKRNYVMLRKLFWKNNICIAAEDVGGSTSRTVALHVDSGMVTVRRPTNRHTLWEPGPDPVALEEGGDSP